MQINENITMFDVVSSPCTSELTNSTPSNSGKLQLKTYLILMNKHNSQNVLSNGTKYCKAKLQREYLMGNILYEEIDFIPFFPKARAESQAT